MNKPEKYKQIYHHIQLGGAPSIKDIIGAYDAICAKYPGLSILMDDVHITSSRDEYDGSVTFVAELSMRIENFNYDQEMDLYKVFHRDDIVCYSLEEVKREYKLKYRQARIDRKR